MFNGLLLLWWFVSQITTVCNFFTYIRYIQQGLVKQQDGEIQIASNVCGITWPRRLLCLAEQIFWEVMQLRREMSLAKLGYYKDQLWRSGAPAAKPRPSVSCPAPLTRACWAWENLLGPGHDLKTVTSSIPERVWVIQTLSWRQACETLKPIRHLMLQTSKRGSFPNRWGTDGQIRTMLSQTFGNNCLYWMKLHSFKSKLLSEVTDLVKLQPNFSLPVEYLTLISKNLFEGNPASPHRPIIVYKINCL